MRLLIPRSRLSHADTPDGVLEAVSAWSMPPHVGIWLGRPGEKTGTRWPVFDVTTDELEAWQLAAVSAEQNQDTDPASSPDCPTCDGIGAQAGAHTERVEPCPTCGGSGKS